MQVIIKYFVILDHTCNKLTFVVILHRGLCVQTIRSRDLHYRLYTGSLLIFKCRYATIFHDLLVVILEVYIDDVVVKSSAAEPHLADLRLVFERMRKYGLKMNPLKCTFGVSAGNFLGFVIHEHGIEIDPKKIEAIQKVEAPKCKRDMQKFLGKVNYLRRFIVNLSGKVSAFTPILQLKSDCEFAWGQSSKKRSKISSGVYLPLR